MPGRRPVRAMARGRDKIPAPMAVAQMVTMEEKTVPSCLTGMCVPERERGGGGLKERRKRPCLSLGFPWLVLRWAPLPDGAGEPAS